jgi:tripartite-type tricarboxylate transporter receptor subunit TctC
LVAPPDIPPARAAALRRAVVATLADPELVALSKKGNLTLEPGSAEELDGVVRKVLATPKPIADKAKAVLESLKTQK